MDLFSAVASAQGSDRYERLGLDRMKREEIGRRCKRLIDQGRCDFVARNIGLDNCRLIYYCDAKISPENVALFASASTQADAVLDNRSSC